MCRRKRLFRRSLLPSNTRSIIEAEQRRESPLFCWYRPQHRVSGLLLHAVLAFVTLVPLLVAWFVPLGRIPFQRCTFLWLTGFPCPFCGVTRSFWAMVNGQWSDALAGSPLGVVVYFCTVFVFAWNTAALLLGVVILPGRFPRRIWMYRKVIVWVGAGLLLANWGYRLFYGMK